MKHIAVQSSFCLPRYAVFKLLHSIYSTSNNFYGSKSKSIQQRLVSTLIPVLHRGVLLFIGQSASLCNKLSDLFQRRGIHHTIYQGLVHRIHGNVHDVG